MDTLFIPTEDGLFISAPGWKKIFEKSGLDWQAFKQPDGFYVCQISRNGTRLLNETFTEKELISFRKTGQIDPDLMHMKEEILLCQIIRVCGAKLFSVGIIKIAF